MKRTSMPLRAVPLSRIPREPGAPQRRAPLAAREPKPKSATRGRGGMGQRKARPAGEFSRTVKLAVRKRAGNGTIEDAMCEACGKGLGRHGGQVQHIVGRGMGGCTDAVINGCANAALLCGTPFDGCHGLATAFDAGIGERGFWLPQGTDPRLVPMRLASEHGSGITVWRAEDGVGPHGTGYMFEAPEEAAA